jgi:hypothetical protein
MIADSHVHFFSHALFVSLFEQKYDRRPTKTDLLRMVEPVGIELPEQAPVQHAERWVRELDAHGVDHAVLFTSTPGEEMSVAAAAQAHPDRFTGWTVVDPRRKDAARKLKRELEKLGLRGITQSPAFHRFDPSDEELAYPIYELAAEHRVPVFSHVGLLRVRLLKTLDRAMPYDLRYANPLLLQRAAMDFPQVTFIIPHLGGGFLREALLLAQACPNVYVDTSGENTWLQHLPQPLTLVEALRRIIGAFGPERVLYGSNSGMLPTGYRADVLERTRKALEEAAVDEQGREAILGGNLARLLQFGQ